MSTNGHIDKAGAYVLFDGVCNVCNGWVQFIIKRDPHALFRFASLQSPEAELLLHTYHQEATLDSIMLIEDGNVYTESTAILQICRKLTGMWKLFYVFIVIPKPVRNALYRWFARNRYRWFGKQESCMIPTPEIRQRFL